MFMKHREVVLALGALAHRNRLEIFRLLVRQGPAGLPAGSIGERVGLAPSSLTFHLQVLQRAGLIKRARAGRQLFYNADYAAMNGIVGYLTHECCAAGAACVPRKSRASRAAKPRS